MAHENLHDEAVPISWLSGADLTACRPNLADRVERLTPEEIKYLAEKVGDALQESYWLAVTIVLDDFFSRQQENSSD